MKGWSVMGGHPRRKILSSCNRKTLPLQLRRGVKCSRRLFSKEIDQGYIGNRHPGCHKGDLSQINVLEGPLLLTSWVLLYAPNSLASPLCAKKAAFLRTSVGIKRNADLGPAVIPPLPPPCNSEAIYGELLAILSFCNLPLSVTRGTPIMVKIVLPHMTPFADLTQEGFLQPSLPPPLPPYLVLRGSLGANLPFAALPPLLDAARTLGALIGVTHQQRGQEGRTDPTSANSSSSSGRFTCLKSHAPENKVCGERAAGRGQLGNRGRGKGVAAGRRNSGRWRSK